MTTPIFMIIKTVIIATAGFGWLYVSRIARRTNALEKIVLAATLTIASAILAGSLAIATALSFEHISNAILVLGAVSLLGVWLFEKPSFALPKTIVKTLQRYWLPASLFCFHIALWTIYFINYPYFPNTDPIDVVWHSDITASVIRRAIVNPVAEAGFPAGSHILFAFTSAYFGISVLASVRIVTAVVEALSVLVAYCLFQRILPAGRAAAYSTVAFSLLIPSGLVYYARLGAYPNIVGDFFVLASLLVARIVSERLTLPSIFVAALIQSTALISHISVPIVAALVIGFSAVVFRQFRAQFHAYLVSNIGFFFLPTAALLATPSAMARQLAYVSKYYLELNNILGLVLQQWLHNYLLFVGPFNFLLLLAALGLVVVTARKLIWPLFLSVWFGLLFLMVFVSTNDWRLILLSLIPGAGLLGILLERLHETLQGVAMRSIDHARTRRTLVALVMLFLIALSIAGGPTIFAVNEASANGQTLKQRGIYESMLWLRDNSPNDSAVISVSLQKEYRYLPIITNLSFRGDYRVASEDIVKLRGTLVFNYVAVSADFYGLETFYRSSAFKAQYWNAAVVVFRIFAPT